MQISTSRFGTVELDNESVIEFPDGLPGFEHTRRYFLAPHKTTEGSVSPFRWLQSVDEPELAFPVINPWTLRPDYAPTINSLVLKQMLISDFKSQAQFLAIVTIPKTNPSAITVNLLAPVLINRQHKMGKQVIVQNESYSIRTPLLSAPTAPHVERPLAAAAA